ncbi:MAG: hypothetical protein KAI43_03225 [Candidatus Aureabacteria bacterium]|nr:hypothetical protein [Candidatus Auribacterota bacterium]
MNLFYRLILWITGIYLLVIITQGLGFGFGVATQSTILFWILAIYNDAKYHEFNFA